MQTLISWPNQRASSESMTLNDKVLSFIQYSPATNEVDMHVVPVETR